MTDYFKNGVKILAGLGAAKLAAASNGDENLSSDKNMNNLLLGGAAGVLLIPKMKHSLDELVKGVANGDKPNYARIGKYVAVGGLAAGALLAFEKGVHKTIVGSLAKAYEDIKPSTS